MQWPAVAMLAMFALSGATLLVALVISRRKRLEMEHRVTLVASDAAQDADIAGLDTRTDVLSAQLHRIFAIGAEQRWGMKASPLKLATIAVTAGLFAWLLTSIAMGMSIWLALPASLFAAFMIPRLILMRQQRKAEARFVDLFPDAVDTISRMLRTGLPITSAIRSVGAEAPPPVNAVFTMVADQIEIGAPLEQALDSASQRIGLGDFRFFTVAIALQHATGGNLASTLETLSDIVRRRRTVRLKAGSTTAEIRVSAYVLGSLPLLIVGALLLIQPGYLVPLFLDPRGHIVLAVAGGLLLLAAVSMRQMMRSVTKA